jgi:hypothetical protein
MACRPDVRLLPESSRIAVPSERAENSHKLTLPSQAIFLLLGFCQSAFRDVRRNHEGWKIA